VPLETTLERTNDTRAPHHLRRSIRALSWVAALALAVLSAAARADGTAAALLPATIFVRPDSTFTMTLSVADVGHAFNGYDAVLSYDPAALTFLQASPLSAQEGSSMVAACLQRFHWFQASGDSLSISHVMLCDGVSLAGPATLYQLRFRAAHTPQYATVHVRRIQFYDQGLFVLPSSGADASIAIGVPVDVPAAPAPSRALLRVLPNPCRSASGVVIEAPAGTGFALAVCDVQGRVVRRLDAGAAGPGTVRVPWDLKDERGARVVPGIYRVFLAGGGTPVGARVVVLP
jgi:hypothetical protein